MERKEASGDTVERGVKERHLSKEADIWEHTE